MHKTSRLFLSVMLFFSLKLSASIHVTAQAEMLPDNTRELYIDLIKKIIVNTIYEDPGRNNDYSYYLRQNGRDFPQTAHTMIGLKGLNNIHDCLKQVIKDNIPGDVIETGVWRGGATILMRAILKAYGDKERRVWVADSFEGLPTPNVFDYPLDKGYELFLANFLAISMEEVQENFKKYDLLDEQVIFLKGFFKDTLPNAPIEKLALLRLDGDLYESTIQALENLYPKLSVGGFIIIDDFTDMVPCYQAVTDFREKNRIKDPIVWVDHTRVFWRKTKE